MCYIFDATERKDSSHLQLLHRQNIPPNVKDICIIPGHGPCEVAFAHSDRVVRLYRWKQQSSEQGSLELVMKWELAGQIGRITLHVKDGVKDVGISD
ncbi:hypothetical protein Ciccas_006712 [Cichlidogyrus casuarinus]|uniref:Uncharacterized protein n=1 Tax=Cichlidogyrus casuarinus TaxID=1844966 RepID=A0ABD2Q4Z0_9PLAT